MKEIVETLKSKGLKLTPQRIAVVKYLRGSKTHVTAEDIFKALHPHFPGMSLATIYNTMEVLSQLGLVDHLSIKKDKAYYDARTDPHHHLLCRKCSRIFDVDIECPYCKTQLIAGHRVEEVHGYFYGLCKNCLKKLKKKKTKRR